MLAGWYAIALPSFALGIQGSCCGLTNVAPNECVELYEAAVERDGDHGSSRRPASPAAEGA